MLARTIKTALVMLSIVGAVVAIMAAIVLMVMVPSIFWVILMVFLTIVIIGCITYLFHRAWRWAYKTVTESEKRGVPLWKHTLRRLYDLWDDFLDWVCSL